MDKFKPSEEEKKMVRSINNKASYVESVKGLKKLEEEFSVYDSPYPSYFLASAYRKFGHEKKAVESFVESAAPWLELPNRYWDSQFSNSVGSSVANIIDRCDLSEVDEELIKMLYALSFSFLSRSIEIIRGIEGIRMMESLFNRGLVSGQNRDQFLYLVQEYVGHGYLTQVMSFSDFYLSHLEYLRDGKKERATLAYENAKREKDWLEDISVAGKEADKYTEEELAKIGVRRNDTMYENMKSDALGGEFNIEEERFKQEIYSSVNM